MKNRKRNRMVGYDYSKNNLYFITSCVKNMKCCFGDVVLVRTGRDLSVQNPNNKINSNNNINPYFFKEKNDEINAEMILNEFGIIANDQLKWLENQYQYIVLHEYVVMPNHIHAVIEIDSLKVNNAKNEASENNLKIKIKSLSQIMGAYKTTSSKLIHQAGFNDFAWHRSFHDHIIRDEKSYYTIVNYIQKNPASWFKDNFFKTY